MISVLIALMEPTYMTKNVHQFVLKDIILKKE